MSSSESTTTSRDNGETEYPDRVHECLRYVPIHRKGAFSCGSSTGEDDDDDCGDEDVKRILAGHNVREPDDRETVDFSPAHQAAAAAATGTATRGPAAAAPADRYVDWDEAERDASATYPPLGVGGLVAFGRATSPSGRRPRTSGPADADVDDVDADVDDYRYCYGDRRGGADGDDDGAAAAAARELRKCLEGALYGPDDLRDFVVAQPFCVADKNLDFGKSKMSPRAVRDAKKKVENWMSRHVADGDAAARSRRY